MGDQTRQWEGSVLGPDGAPAVPVDVLVFGGGIQGLWLLRDLRASGYRTLLLDPKPLGGAQTLHSHGFLHAGHAYPHEGSFAHFSRATERWTRFFEEAPETASPSAAHVGFLALANAQFWEQRWRAGRLGFQCLPQPPALL